MAMDGVSIAGIVYELKNRIVGGRIYKIYQPEEDEICLVIKNKTEDCNTSDRLVLSANAGLPMVYISDKNTVVLAEKNGIPTVTAHKFLKGRAVYIASWKFSFDVTRILFRAICYTMNATEKEQKEYVTSNIFTECAYYPDINKTVIINNSAENQKTSFVNAQGETISVELKPFETIIK